MTSPLPQRGNVSYAFSTPILMQVWPESTQLNAELQELVLARERADKGVIKSNLGGWQSEQGLFHWQHPAIAVLQQRVREATIEITSQTCGQALQGLAMDMHVNGWANVSRDRSYNRIHAHSECTWSGVYYVSTGEPDPAVTDNGAIEFFNAGLTAHGGVLPGRPFGGQLRVSPEPGLMVMFPSWLPHWVHPFQGSGTRISLAFNVTLRFRPADEAPR